MLQTGDREHPHRLGLALDRHRRPGLEYELIADGLAHTPRDQDLTRRGLRHQAGGGIHLVADGAERAPRRAAITAHAQGAAAQAHLQRGAIGSQLLQHRQRGAQGAAGIVFVRLCGAEVGVETSTVGVHRHLQQHAAMLVHGALRLRHAGGQLVGDDGGVQAQPYE